MLHVHLRGVVLALLPAQTTSFGAGLEGGPGHSRLELSRFLNPPVIADHRTAPVNALGYLRVMFTVKDIDDTLTRLSAHGAQLVGELVEYEDTYRLCYIRGPEGLLIGLAEELKK